MATKEENGVDSMKRRILYTFFLLILVASVIPCFALESADDYMKLGNDAFQKGDYDSAIHNYTLAQGVDANRIDVYLNRGSAYYNKGQFDQAMKNYNNAANLDPNNLLTYQYRAATYLELGQYQKCRQEVKMLQSMGGIPDPAFLLKLKEFEEGKKPEGAGGSLYDALPLAVEYQKTDSVVVPAPLGVPDSSIGSGSETKKSDDSFGSSFL